MSHVTSHVTLQLRPRKRNHENTKTRNPTKKTLILVTSLVTLRLHPRTITAEDELCMGDYARVIGFGFVPDTA